jgi:hypothetical protein
MIQHKFYLILILTAFPLFLMGQERVIDENGRTQEQIVRKKNVPNPSNELPVMATPRNGSDKDVGAYDRPPFAPLATQEDLAALHTMIQELSNELNTENLPIEELEMKINAINKSLQLCCRGASFLVEKKNPPYLLQNAPNPFNELSKIQYFVPEEAFDATIQIRDLKGTVIQSFDLNEKGFGLIEVGQETLNSGSYIYTLKVDGQLVDSKIMILTK